MKLTKILSECRIAVPLWISHGPQPMDLEYLELDTNLVKMYLCAVYKLLLQQIHTGRCD